MWGSSCLLFIASAIPAVVTSLNIIVQQRFLLRDTCFRCSSFSSEIASAAFNVLILQSLSASGYDVGARPIPTEPSVLVTLGPG